MNLPFFLWQIEKYSSIREISFLDKFLKKQLSGDKADQDQASKGKAAMVHDGLYELTMDNFDDHVAKGSHFIKFYAPLCKHCQNMQEAWEELAEKLGENGDVKIGSVSVT